MRNRLRLVFFLATLLLAGPTAVHAQAQKAPRTPDVIYVPTPQEVVEDMLRLVNVKKGDVLYDLGSGDGRIPITAAKLYGVRAVGIDIDPQRIAEAQENAKKAGVTHLVEFRQADLFMSDFREATVITLYLLPELNVKLRPKILNLKPGTRIVSNSFTMGDWKEDERADLTADAGCSSSSWCTALLWIVPARVAGTHKLPQGEVTLKQTYQMLSGTLSTEGKNYALEGKVRGEDVTFKAGGREYRGRMNGKSLELR